MRGESHAEDREFSPGHRAPGADGGVPGAVFEHLRCREPALLAGGAAGRTHPPHHPGGTGSPPCHRSCQAEPVPGDGTGTGGVPGLCGALPQALRPAHRPVPLHRRRAGLVPVYPGHPRHRQPVRVYLGNLRHPQPPGLRHRQLRPFRQRAGAGEPGAVGAGGRGVFVHQHQGRPRGSGGAGVAQEAEN